MGRGQHDPQDRKARAAKYSAHFSVTEKNKKRHIEKMKKLNPNWPAKKAK